MSLLATEMLAYRNSDHMMDKWETRMSQYGAFAAFQKQNNDVGAIIPANIRNEISTKISRTVQLPVINFDAGVTIGSSRTLTIADDENTSALYTVSLNTYTFGFTMVPTLYQNNEIGYRRDFQAKMEKYIYALGAELDNDSLTALETAKTQVLGDTLGGEYTFGVNDTVAGALAKQDQIVGDLGPLQATNDFYGELDVIGNQSLRSVIRNRLLEKATYNTENKTYQWGDKTFYYTNRLANGVDIKATGFAIPSGSLAFLYQFERECIVNGVSPTGHMWGIEQLPMLNIPIGTYYYPSVGDFSAIAGAASADMDRVRKQHFGFAGNYATVVAYNSDNTTLAGPVMKFSIATS